MIYALSAFLDGVCFNAFCSSESSSSDLLLGVLGITPSLDSVTGDKRSRSELMEGQHRSMNRATVGSYLLDIGAHCQWCVFRGVGDGQGDQL
jgi:hypothetical protein